MCWFQMFAFVKCCIYMYFYNDGKCYSLPLNPPHKIKLNPYTHVHIFFFIFSPWEKYKSYRALRNFSLDGWKFHSSLLLDPPQNGLMPIRYKTFNRRDVYLFQCINRSCKYCSSRHNHDCIAVCHDKYNAHTSYLNANHRFLFLLVQLVLLELRYNPC